MKRTKYERIRDWARNRGIYDHGDPKTQVLKLMEEVGELSEAVLKQNDADFYDAIGDCVVVLTNVVELYELERIERVNGNTLIQGIENCIESSIRVIEKRTGKMQNGTFVKDE